MSRLPWDWCSRISVGKLYGGPHWRPSGRAVPGSGLGYPCTLVPFRVPPIPLIPRRPCCLAPHSLTPQLSLLARRCPQSSPFWHQSLAPTPHPPLPLPLYPPTQPPLASLSLTAECMYILPLFCSSSSPPHLLILNHLHIPSPLLHSTSPPPIHSIPTYINSSRDSSTSCSFSFLSISIAFPSPF
jgi:hypothetical protein